MASYNSRIVGEGESLAEEVFSCFKMMSLPAPVMLSFLHEGPANLFPAFFHFPQHQHYHIFDYALSR